MMLYYLCSYGLDLYVRLIHWHCWIPFDKSHIMDDVDVHLLLFPYYICTAMSKKVMLWVKKLCQKAIPKYTDSGLHFHVYIHEMQIYKHQEMSAKAYKLFFEGKKIVSLNPDDLYQWIAIIVVGIKKIFVIVICQFKIVFRLIKEIVRKIKCDSLDRLSRLLVVVVLLVVC